MTQLPIKTSVFDDIFSTSLFYSGAIDKILDDFKVNKVYEGFCAYPYNIKDVYATDNEKRISAEKPIKTVLEIALAGFDKSEISVTIVDGKLVVNAETKKNTENTDEAIDYRHHGISKRNCVTSINLGAKADKTNVTSSFKNGMLVVEVPWKVDEKNTIVIND